MSDSQRAHVWAVDQFEAFKIKSCKCGRCRSRKTPALIAKIVPRMCRII